MEFREKRKFFTLRPPDSKRKRDIGMGQMGKMMLTYRATNALLTNSGCRAVLTMFLPAQSWEMPVKRELPAKIGRCNEKPSGHNFDFKDEILLRENFYIC